MNVFRVFDDGRHKVWLEVSDDQMALFVVMDVDGIPFSVEFDKRTALLFQQELSDAISRVGLELK